VWGEVDHHDQWRWPRPYRTYTQLLGHGGGLASVDEAHQRIWTSVVEAVPVGAAALVVGHGGGIDPRLVACLPDADFDAGRFVSVRFRRAAGRRGTAARGARRVDVEGARSFRWSFPHAIPAITGRHQADDVSDLSRVDSTSQCPPDARGSTSNP
jgi:hypothetical protein